MSNVIFDSLFRERANLFCAAFSATSKELFFDPKDKKFRHSGEFGMYRESIVRDFFKFIVPRRLDISTGFLITAMNDTSTQCDIVIFDSQMTPLYEEGDRQRFYPIETVFCVGEVKSKLSKKEFSKALNKLAAVKALGERIPHPAMVGASESLQFDPIFHPYHLFPSILICQKLNFSIKNIQNELDDLYDEKVLHRHKHNMILSVEDGLLSYVNKDGINLPYPRLLTDDLKHRFSFPGKDKYAHLKLFGSFMFMLTANKQLFYPEFTDYICGIDNATNQDQT